MPFSKPIRYEVFAGLAPRAPVAWPHFNYRGTRLFAENADLGKLVEKHGSPLYVYSKAALKEAWKRYELAQKQHNVLVCFGMKANSNLSILRMFAKWGSGFDIVSGGEMMRALEAGACADKIVFSGVGKLPWEIRKGLEVGIKCFNVESLPELALINEVASQMGMRAPVSLRINPDVDAGAHPYISTGLKENKFGIPMEDAFYTYQQANALNHIDVVGIDCHIGSQITDLSPFMDAVDNLLALVKKLQDEGIRLHHLDIGGGLGICYKDENPPEPIELVEAITKKLQEADLSHMQLVLEPGRSLVGNCGVLLSQVIYLKHGDEKNFAIIDAAMNDLIRPTLYDAYHGVLPVTHRGGEGKVYDVVGPVCETGDWLAKERELRLRQGDFIAIESCGAYGFVMGSQYNTRPRAAEVLVDGSRAYLIRERETVRDIYAKDILY